MISTLENGAWLINGVELIEDAAGAAEALAAILALRHSVVPPTINLDEKDPECDLDYTPNKAVEAEITIAISDSLGFGGHNSCVAFRKV